MWRIYSEFAADKSAIDIAKGLNADGIPSPRGGEWGASTIRGDPKKFTGILNNPLHRGILIWGRREWRRDSDSERRYRMRDEAKWGREQMPDPWMVDEALVASVDAEFATCALPQHSDMSRSNRKRHLLSGLIKCSQCGSNFTLTGKDYYRCVVNRERGTCDNSTTIRTGAVEAATLFALNKQLPTDDMADLFIAEFRRDVAKLASTRDERESRQRARLAQLDIKIENLAANMLVGVISPTIVSAKTSPHFRRR